MYFEKNGLEQLVARIRRGDAAAVAEFLKKVQPQLVRLVGWVIRTSATETAIGRLVVAELRQLLARGNVCLATDGARLIQDISNRLCWTAIERLRSRAVGSGQMLETVLGN